IQAYINTQSYKKTSIKNRVEHLQVVNREDIKNMADNDIGGSFFITHIYYFGDVHKNIFLGPERVKKMEPVKWADELGMVSTIHSDCPVTDISPLGSIRIACERKTRNGEVLGENMKLDRAAAYRKMTSDAAELNGTDDVEGTVEVGKYADFAVLSENPFEEKTELSDELVQMTIVNGEVVFKK